MSIKLTDELVAATTQGKLASAKQVFLDDEITNLQKVFDDTKEHLINLDISCGSANQGVGLLIDKSEDLQRQVDSNDKDIESLQTRSTQMEETIKTISTTGGASKADAVTYDNGNSGLTALNAQSAIDELAAKDKSQDEVIDTKVDKEEGKSLISALVAGQLSVVEHEGNVVVGMMDAKGKELMSVNKDGDFNIIDKLKAQSGYSIKAIETGADCLYALLDANGNVVTKIDTDGKFNIQNSLNSEDGYSLETIDTMADSLYAVLDSNRNVVLNITKEGKIQSVSGITFGDVNTGINLVDSQKWLFAIVDANKEVLWGIMKSGVVYQPRGIPEEARVLINQLTKRVEELQDKIDNKANSEINNKFLDKVMLYGNAGRAYLGNVALQEPGTTDYCIIMMYGQSLSNGSENPAGFNDDVVDRCFMLGSNVWTTTGSQLQALRVGGTVRADGVATGTRQDTIVSTVNTFVSLYKKERPWDTNTKFIACSMGVGGRTVAQLSGNKYADGNNTTLRYPNCNEKWLETNVKTFFQSVKAIADGEGKTISLSAVFWKQGESDYGTGYIGKTYDEWKAIQDAKTSADSNSMQGSKDAYKKGLTILKEDIFALAKEIFGDDQANRPVFMPYSVCGQYINNAYQTINDATAEIANEQDDVVQVGPTYVTPDYNGGHLAMNGYRWFGEYCAKTLYYVFLKHMDFRPLQPESFDVKDNKIYIYINPIVPPLRIDKYTPGSTYKNLGFSVRMGTVSQLDGWKSMTSGGLQTITDITLSENCIILTCGNIEKFTDAVEVSYAGQGESGYSGHNQGAGNVRDCDTWQAKYSYRDDSADHGSRNSTWTGSTKATEEELKTLEYWDASYASATGYSNGDKVLFNLIEIDGPVVITSTIDNNKNNPVNPLNYHTTDVKGNTIVGKPYPMQNWLLNFYKRIVLG